MSKEMKNSQMKICPQCDNHCPADALQCGKGRRFFGVEEENRSHREPDCLTSLLQRCGHFVHHTDEEEEILFRVLTEEEKKVLQELLGIQAGSMSEIAAKLEDRGLITRMHSKEDRRKVSLSITEQGRAWMDQSDEAHIIRRRAELFAVLTPEEQRALGEMLGKLSADWSQRAERRDGVVEAHDHGA